MSRFPLDTIEPARSGTERVTPRERKLPARRAMSSTPRPIGRPFRRPPRTCKANATGAFPPLRLVGSVDTGIHIFCAAQLGAYATWDVRRSACCATRTAVTMLRFGQVAGHSYVSTTHRHRPATTPFACAFMPLANKKHRGARTIILCQDGHELRHSHRRVSSASCAVRPMLERPLHAENVRLCQASQSRGSDRPTVIKRHPIRRLVCSHTNRPPDSRRSTLQRASTVRRADTSHSTSNGTSRDAVDALMRPSDRLCSPL